MFIEDGLELGFEIAKSCGRNFAATEFNAGFTEGAVGGARAWW